MNAIMVDRETGATVLVKDAQLSQRCGECMGPLLAGELIVCVRGSNVGWSHVRHLGRLLLKAGESSGFAAARAREQLADAKPGDRVELTEDIMVGLGMDSGS